MKLGKALTYICSLLIACVTPIDVITIYSELIVIEGVISDQPGPYQIKISKTLPLNYLSDSSQVSNAVVVIIDDLGNKETLLEKEPGNYYTSSLQGVVGRSYSLMITTKQGWVYQSLEEKLLPVGDFKLYQQFKQNEPNPENAVYTKNGFDIFVDSDVLPEQEKRVLWRWNGIFKIATEAQLRTKVIYDFKSGKDVIVADPPDCSGWGAIPNGGIFQFNSCSCCTCWVTDYNQSPIISNPTFINNEKINGLKIGFVMASARTLYDKYYMEVEQLSLSQPVYNFWKEVLIQERNSSNLFQVPPPRSTGNIKAISANALPVIGYFSASSIKAHTLTLTYGDVPYPKSNIDIIPLDCRDAYKLSSTTKPPFW